MDNINDNFTVSVIIPAYNAANHIARAIDSVLSQSHKPDEIIIIDDGSTDDTQSIVQKYLPNVTYIYQANAGVSAARNTGIETANSEWIAFLDSDDEWSTDILKLQIELLKQHPHLVWTTANYTVCLCDEQRKRPIIEPLQAANILNGKTFHEDFFSAFKRKAAGWTGTMLIKKSVLIDNNSFNPTLKTAEDIDLWFRIAMDHPQIGYIPQSLATYHISTPHSITKSIRTIEAQSQVLKANLKLAAEKNKLTAIEPCVARIVSIWIRGLLFQNQPQQIKNLMMDFGRLLNPCFKLLVNILMLSPKTTAACCHTISKILRSLKLRKKLTNPPPKIQN